ncbi:hypothetical protein [Coleofasciculus sp.]|uniref:hypothetical protein n=1 Tax=Coleofasciculus sp. TaxID=3100458 RepID=UPI003A1C5A9B
MIEEFVGFYTSRPFWAGDPPVDLETLSTFASQLQVSETRSQFREFMSAIVFSYKTNGIRLCVCKDGMLLVQVKNLEIEIEKIRDGLDIEAQSQLWGQYLDYINCLYLLLDSVVIEIKQFAYFNLSEVTNRDVSRLRFKDGKCMGQSIAHESITSVYQRSRYEITPDMLTSLFRQSFSKNIFDVLFEKYSIATANPSLLKNLAEVTKNLSEYKVGNYSTSLVLAWFVIESKIIRLWDKLIDNCNRDFDDGTRRISKDRQKTLTGRDYTISVISNFLELSDLIPFKVFQDINAVRKFRNKVVHGDSNFNCDAKRCQQAIELALHLTLEGTGLTVLPNYTYSIPGL